MIRGIDRNVLVLHHGLTSGSLDVPSLAELLSDVREHVDLPVKDLAALCGVRRRQFYNLLSGSTTGTPREQHIRLIHQVVSELSQVLGHDQARVRAALLMPIGDEHRSLYDDAVAGDDAAVRHTATELVERLRRGDVRGLLPRPSPRFRGSVQQAREFLSGFAGEAEGESDR